MTGFSRGLYDASAYRRFVASITFITSGDARLSLNDSIHFENLIWALESPGLLAPCDQIVTDSWCRSVLMRHRPRLEDFLQRPGFLTSEIESRCRNRRLGEYFEVLLSFWLEDILGYPEVKRSVQVHNAERTIGEFDFLFKETPSSQLQHWEVAIKFYLYDPATGVFFGPAAKDRFDRKLSLVFNQQLKLSETAGLKNVVARALLEGRLFYPLDKRWREVLIDPILSVEHARGWWTTSAEQAVCAAHADSRWVIHNTKRTWLAGGAAGPRLDGAQLIERCKDHFSTENSSLMVSEVTADGIGPRTEISRGFIVHPHWPFQKPKHAGSETDI